MQRLFQSIYPDSPEMAGRMSYAEDNPLHLKTLLALQNGEAIGHINVFRVCERGELANIGYHVHPHFHLQGIGSLLIEGVLSGAPMVRDGLVVQTVSDNAASIALAKKYGFDNVPQEILAKYGHYLKFKHRPNGICLYRNPVMC